MPELRLFILPAGMRRETIGELLNNSNNFNHPVKWVEPALGFQKRGGGRDGAMEGGKGQPPSWHFEEKNEL